MVETNIDYTDIVKHFYSINDRKTAWFIQKYYIEKKNMEQIIEEMYMNTPRWYYSLRKKVQKRIKFWIICRKW